MEMNQLMALRLLKLLTENKSLLTGYNAALLEIDSLHAENETLQAGYDAARMEIASLHERLESSKKANDDWAAKTHALEAKNLGLLHALTAEQDENHALHQHLAAIGAGGVEPLRKRERLHSISDPAQIYSDVQRDAERYRFIRDVPYSDDVRSVLVHQQNAAMDRVIDAAIAAQGGV